jgi:hypothetical protein
MLSEKQKKFIYESVAKINIAHGSVRSGKTHATLIRFVELVHNCPDSKIIMIGNSFGAIKTNAVKFLTDEILRGYCIWKPGTQTLIIGDKQVRVIGAHDEGSVRPDAPCLNWWGAKGWKFELSKATPTHLHMSTSLLLSLIISWTCLLLASVMIGRK